MKETLLTNLARYPLCEFFLRRCVESMSDQQVESDLAAEPDVSLLQHLDKPDQMGLLQDLFSETMKTFALSKEELKEQAEFNFDVYDIRNFESMRAVFRLANALSKNGFAQFTFLRDAGLADLQATKDPERWFIEVKTLVLQTRRQEFEIEGTVENLAVDRFQPDTCKIADYVEKVSRQIAGKLGEARQQLLDTVQRKGDGKRMVAIVVNLVAAPFFLDLENLRRVEARLRGRSDWEKDYLADVDALAFLTDELYVFLCA